MSIITRTNAAYYGLDMGYASPRIRYLFSDPKVFIPFDEGSGTTVKDLVSGTDLAPANVVWHGDDAAYLGGDTALPLNNTIPFKVGRDTIMFMFKFKADESQDFTFTAKMENEAENQSVEFMMTQDCGEPNVTVLINGTVLADMTFDPTPEEFNDEVIGFKDGESGYIVVFLDTRVLEHDVNYQNRGGKQYQYARIAFCSELSTLENSSAPAARVYGGVSSQWMAEGGVYTEEKGSVDYSVANANYNTISTVEFDITKISFASAANGAKAQMMGVWVVDHDYNTADLVAGLDVALDVLEATNELPNDVMAILNGAQINEDIVVEDQYGEDEEV